MNKFTLEAFQRTGSEGGKKSTPTRKLLALCRKLRREGAVETAELLEAMHFDGRPTPPLHNAESRAKISAAALKREAAKRGAKEAASEPR
jgi:hypothetical protein